VVDDHPGLVDERPVLKELQISGTGVQSRPAFSPHIFRYAVYPTASTEDLTVIASPGDQTDRITVDGKLAEGGKRMALSGLEAGDHVTVEVTDVGGNVMSYELVYLPVGFPVLDVSILDAANVSPGLLYLTATEQPLSGSKCIDASSRCYVMIVDNFGVPVYYRQEEYPSYDFKLQPGGWRSYEALVSHDEFGNTMAEAVVLDQDFQEVGRYAAPGLPNTNHHDFLILPDGDRVFISYVTSSRGSDGSGGAPNTPVTDGVFEEVDTEGHVVFRWSSEDHVPVADSVRPMTSPYDYFHLNSIALEPNGNYLISGRGTSQVYEVDRRTGNILWRLGGTASDFEIVGDPLGTFCGQHTVTRLGNGDILLFDNGQAMTGGLANKTTSCPPAALAAGHAGISRVAEYRLDQEAGVARLVWSYRQGTYAPSSGSAQRLGNGNTLIGWGENSSALLATEVDPSGNKVFELSGVWPDGWTMVSYRVYRFPR